MDEEQILDLAERNRPYFAKRLKAEGYHICIDTNGFVRSPEALEVIALSDLILPDLKQINPKKHLLLV